MNLALFFLIVSIVNTFVIFDILNNTSGLTTVSLIYPASVPHYKKIRRWRHFSWQSGGRAANDSSFEGVEWDEFDLGSPDDTAQVSSAPEALNKSRESAKSGIYQIDLESTRLKMKADVSDISLVLKCRSWHYG